MKKKKADAEIKRTIKCSDRIPKVRSWVCARNLIQGEKEIAFVKVAYLGGGGTTESKAGFFARGKQEESLRFYSFSEFVGIVDGKKAIVDLQKAYFDNKKPKSKSMRTIKKKQ